MGGSQDALRLVGHRITWKRCAKCYRDELYMLEMYHLGDAGLLLS